MTTLFWQITKLPYSRQFTKECTTRKRSNRCSRWHTYTVMSSYNWKHPNEGRNTECLHSHEENDIYYIKLTGRYLHMDEKIRLQANRHDLEVYAMLVQGHHLRAETRRAPTVWCLDRARRHHYSRWPHCIHIERLLVVCLHIHKYLYRPSNTVT